MSAASSPYVCVFGDIPLGSLVSSELPKHARKWIGYAQLPLGVSERVQGAPQ